MSLRNMVATVPFASLLGIRMEEETEKERAEREEKTRRAEWEKKAESDPERARKDEESDDEYSRRMEEMDAEEADGGGDGDKEEEEEDKDGNGKKGKKAAKDKDEDPDDEDGDKEKAARSAERVRCAKIIAFGIQSGCVAQAGVFAFDTSMSARAAIAALKAAKIDGRRGALGERMSQIRMPILGDGGAIPEASARSVAAAIIAAGEKRRGER